MEPSTSIVSDSVLMAQQFEKLGIIGILAILILAVGFIAYYLLKRILNDNSSLKNITAANESLERMFAEFKKEFQTHNELTKRFLEEQKNSNEIYRKIIEKSIYEMRLDLDEVKRFLYNENNSSFKNNRTENFEKFNNRMYNEIEI